MHAGKVYAVDMDDKLLAVEREKAPPNLVTVLAATDDPRLPEGSAALIFFCDGLHHIENRPAHHAKLARILKPGGRVPCCPKMRKPMLADPK